MDAGYQEPGTGHLVAEGSSSRRRGGSEWGDERRAARRPRGVAPGEASAGIGLIDRLTTDARGGLAPRRSLNAPPVGRRSYMIGSRDSSRRRNLCDCWLGFQD